MPLLALLPRTVRENLQELFCLLFHYLPVVFLLFSFRVILHVYRKKEGGHRNPIPLAAANGIMRSNHLPLGHVAQNEQTLVSDLGIPMQNPQRTR
jgi:hypothetical protein